MRYNLRSLVYYSTEPQVFDGAFEALNPMTDIPTCHPDVPPTTCYGHDGCQVLQTVKNVFDAVSCDDNTANDILCLMIMIVVMKFLFVVGLFGRSTGMKTPKPPPAMLK